MPEAIGKALACGFAELQNPDQDKFPVFCGLARVRPAVFLGAAQFLCFAPSHQSNFDWIEAALFNARDEVSIWQEMAEHVRNWLSSYSLSPERSMFSHASHDPKEKVEAERKKVAERIALKLSALSEPEKKLRDSLVETDGDLVALSSLALKLMAGKPLAPFANSLVQWSFSAALNGGPFAPHKALEHLVRFNRVDWSEARKALLQAAEDLQKPQISATGKWALVTVLRATGDVDDAAAAEALVEELTKHRPEIEFGSWRLVEKYCATDPCDPGSSRPENIEETADKYAALDVSLLRCHMSSTGEDNFFEMARTGLVRFEPKVAIAKHREFAADVAGRDGLPLRQGIIELRNHCALLSEEIARSLIRQSGSGKGVESDDLTEKNRWFISQYRFLLAFPFLSGFEQLESVLTNSADKNILLELMNVTKSVEEGEFEHFLEEAYHQNDARAQHILLAFAQHTDTRLSANSRSQIALLTKSDSELIRGQALGIIARSGDDQLLAEVAKGEWCAADAEKDEGYEVWNGSLAILNAASRDLIGDDEALNRISARLYGKAAMKLGDKAVSDIAQRVDVAIHHAIDLETDLAVPEIEYFHRPEEEDEPPRFTVSERQTGPPDLREEFQRFSESMEASEQRQRRNFDAFYAFKAELTRSKAEIIINRLSLAEFDRIASSHEELAERWFQSFIALPDTNLSVVHNLIVFLGHALGKKEPDKAAQLFRRIHRSEPLIRFAYGRVGIPLAARAIWDCLDHPVLNDLRFERLDAAGNDHELSVDRFANGEI